MTIRSSKLWLQCSRFLSIVEWNCPMWTDDYTLKVYLSKCQYSTTYTLYIKDDVAKNSLTGQFIDGDASGTEGADDNGLVDVYNLQGIMVRSQVPSNEATQGLPAGIYIAGHRKVIVK